MPEPTASKLVAGAPSIANGLVAGIDQIPPLSLQAGRTMGATRLRGAWHIVMPGALPGYPAGLKQGRAFSWRSLMAAEIIVSSPDLGVGLGQLLRTGATTPVCRGVPGHPPDPARRHRHRPADLQPAGAVVLRSRGLLVTR